MNEFLTKFDDSLNPILVKDLRQIVRGKFIWGVLLLLLGIIVLILGISLLEAGTSIRGDINGEFISYAMSALLFFACGLIIPIQIGRKTSEEVNDATHELIFTTTMTSSSIVKGKILSGTVTIIMLYATVAPFLSLTLYMGGVDIKNLFVAMVYSFIVSHVAVLFQVNAGMSYRSEAVIASIGHKAGIIISHIIGWFFAASIGSMILSGDLLRRSGTADFWTYTITFIISVIFISIIFYMLTVSRIQTESSNRTYFLKFVTSVIWCIGSLLCSFDKEFSLGWTAAVFIALIPLSVFLLLDPENYSRRVLSEIPKNPIGRVLAYPFYTGMLNSYVWIVITGILTLFYSMRYYSGSHRNDFFSFLACVITMLISSHSYFFISNFIKNMLFKDKSRTYIFNIFATIVAIVVIGSFIAENLIYPYHSGWASLLSPFSMCYFVNGDNIIVCIIATLVIWGISLILNINRIGAQLITYFDPESKLKEDYMITQNKG